MALIGYSHAREFLGIDISVEQVKFPAHRLEFRKSYGMIVSKTITCKNCGIDMTNSYLKYGECSRPLYTYLNRPTWPEENITICSTNLYEKHLIKLKQRMVGFVRKFQKHNLFDGFVSGTSSISAQAYQELLTEGKLVLKKRTDYKYAHESHKLVVNVK